LKLRDKPTKRDKKKKKIELRKLSRRKKLTEISINLLRLREKWKNKLRKAINK